MDTRTQSPSTVLRFVMEELEKVGGHFFPCKPFRSGSATSKEPAASGWRTDGIDTDRLIALYESSPRGIGWAIPPGIAVIDADAPSADRPGKRGIESLQRLVNDLRLDLTSVPGAVTTSKSMHFYFRIPQGVLVRGRLPGDYPDIDVKTHGGYVLIPGSPHWGGGYYWYNQAVERDVKIDPPQMPSQMFDLIRRSSIIRLSPNSAPVIPVEMLRSVLNYIPTEDFRGKGGDEFWKLLASAKFACGGNEEGLREFLTWCRRDPEYDTDENETKVINRWQSETTGEITTGTLLYFARKQLVRLDREGKDADWKACNSLIHLVRCAADADMLAEMMAAEQAQEVRLSEQMVDPLAAYAESPPGAEDDGAETIICGRNMASFVRRVEQRYPILAQRYKLFVYEGKLCEMIRTNAVDWHAESLSPESLLVKLAESFVLLVESDRIGGPSTIGDWELVHAKLLLNQTHWPGVPIVTEIVTHPIISSDGRIIQGRGVYCDETFVWTDDDEIQPVPEEVDWVQASLAARSIVDAIGTDRFLSYDYISVWLAGFLSVVYRHAIDGPVPMIIATSEGGSAGKTTMAQIPEMILTGNYGLVVNTNFSKPERADTEIGAALLNCLNSLVIDDIECGEEGVESRLLNSLLTSRRPSIRPLHTSDMRRLPRGPQIWMTGLNARIRPGSTLERRLLPLVLVAPDQPTGMTAQGSFESRIKAQRKSLLRCAAVILRGWIQSGEKKPGAWASFEAWDEMVRQAVIWAGLPDPCSVRATEESRVVMGTESEKAKDERIVQAANCIVLIREAVAFVQHRDPLADAVSSQDIVSAVNHWRQNSSSIDGLQAYRNLSSKLMSGSPIAVGRLLTKMATFMQPVNGEIIKAYARPSKFRIARVQDNG